MHPRRLVFLTLLCLLTLAIQASDNLVTVLVPGFETEELPVKLSNINNLRFSPDGKLTALGYDGRIHLLEDTDGDGLEDKSSLFWGEPTLRVPVGMVWSEEGLYVSSNGKISFFPDADRDGKADREEIIASGWPGTGTPSGNVDATAITMDKNGNLYFGLLTEHYANPYLIKDGVARYDLSNKRGTIQKWNRSTKQLETVATGIRVPYHLAFNKQRDLFNTDQEGETWCPGGNPFDELNHIVLGKNYGFPPRHPVYLPDLVSEPPVVAFGPQHQSACGFVFNEPGPGQKLFGPASWEDDVFVTGESRGKIWRVAMVKTPSGYLGKEMLFARLKMLTTDVAISPQGQLYVSCHSGKPDWGTGPKGEGKLFRIRYEDTAAPQPVAVWAAGPMEVRVAFDKPLSPAITNDFEEVQIEFGEPVSPADRLENLKPPYKVVAQQEATPRGRLKAVGAELSEDRRTLSLATDPHPQAVSYAITIPGIHGAQSRGGAATVDLGYSLNGVEARWTPDDASTRAWSGWFPHLDAQANRLLTIGSSEHEQFYKLVPAPGNLVLRTRFAPPDGTVKIQLVASLPFTGELDGQPFRSATVSEKEQVELPTLKDPSSLAIRMRTGLAASVYLHAAYQVEGDLTARPLPFNAFQLPWAPRRQPPSALPVVNAELDGGDYERGRSLFFGEKLKCSTCHAIRGAGKNIGPDLTNLPHRDIASVLRDLREPNALINPDYTAYNVVLRDGSEISGFVRAQSPEMLRVVDAAGQERAVPRSEVERFAPSSVSLMPSGLLEGLKESQVRDLLTFLMHEPPTRKPGDVKALLKAPVQEVHLESKSGSVAVVLVANKQDHGTGQHDYPRWQTNFNAFLSASQQAEVQNAWEWPSEEQFENAQLLVFYYWNRGWNAEKFAQLDRYLERGGGMAVFHSSTISDKDPEELARRIGLAAQPKTVKYLHAPMDLKFVVPSNHVITAGLSKLHLLDEPYWPMIGDTNQITVLATATQEKQEWPMMWTFEKGKGRVFASIPGHYTWTLEDPVFRVLKLRALAWAAGRPSATFLDAIERQPGTD